MLPRLVQKSLSFKRQVSEEYAIRTFASRSMGKMQLYQFCFLFPTFLLPRIAGLPCNSSNLTAPLRGHNPSYSANITGTFDQTAITVSAIDDRYDDLIRQSNNRRYVADAAYIVIPTDAAQVVETLRYAVANNLRPTVRSGSHCFEDFWTNNTGGVLIDLSAMTRIYRSPNDSTVWMESGVKIGDAYDILSKYGLVLPAGTCSDMAIGGHTLGAGYGYMARKFGVLSDYAHSFEMAYISENKTVELALVSRNSTDEKERNLYWALCGAGQQNFGIVTKIGFLDLPKPPSVFYVYYSSWALNTDMDKEQFTDFLGKYTQFFANHSAPDDEYCDVFADLRIGRKGEKKYVSFTIILVGEKRRLVDTFLETIGLNAANFSCEMLSYYRFIRTTGFRIDLSKLGDYFVGRSAYMKAAMPQYQIETIWRYVTDSNYSYVADATVQLKSYGCAVSRIPETASAYPHRRASIKMQYATAWYKIEDASAHMRWSQDLYRDMYGHSGPMPDAVMDGCYVGYPDGELINGQRLYYKDNYARLQEVKRQWDPLNIFYHRQSIELAEQSIGNYGSRVF